MTKTVSVALATYNGANFLRAQLDSIASQTKTPDELIVTDDCSTDNTVDIVREFAKTVSFPVVVHINEKKVGYTQNFSRALSLCSGDIVFLSDQDDVWLSNKVDNVVNVFNALPKTLLVIHDIE